MTSTPPSQTSAGPGRRRRSAARTNLDGDQGLSLLQALLDDPLGYEHLSGAHAPRPRSQWRSVTLFVFTVIVAFVLTVSARTVLEKTDPGAATRARLTEQIQLQEERLDQLSKEVHELKGAAAILLKSDRQTEAIEPRYLQAAQATEVVGRGITVTLTEAAGDNRGKDRVTDGDLRILANQLWEGGAEAVSVNNRRLGAMTAIRTAGGTVLVDFRPVEPPYVVSAIGDPQSLTEALKSGQAGEYFDALYSVYGISLQIRQVNDLQLAPAQLRSLKSAHSSERNQE